MSSPSNGGKRRWINGHRKGSAYERHVCRLLSLWWTSDRKRPSEDVFWRSAGSGGMAKRRGRGGKTTFGQHGDIMAVDPVGAPLLDVFTVEVKKGYNRFTPFDAMDRHATHRKSTFEAWVDQATESATHAGSYAWMILFQRNGRRPMIAMPAFAIRPLAPKTAFPTRVEMRIEGLSVVSVLLDDFFARVTPASVRELANK